tara:strand:- start:1120 stop:2019 length:900 start_codon:yes stop_codon:yes gene_type:complete
MDKITNFKTYSEESFNGALMLGFVESGSAEWHAMREQGIGGSEIGTICGLNPWESAFALWAKRTGQIPNPPIDNWSVRFGRAFEQPVLELWAEEHPEFDVYLVGTFRHPSIDYMHANPDALACHRDTGEWIVVEVKTARGTWADAPPAYVAQVQHYMDVLGLERSVIVAVAGWNYEERWIDRDQFRVDAQREAAKRFWDHLSKMEKPEWDGSKATYEATRYMNPHIEDDDVDLGGLGLSLVKANEMYAEAETLLTKAKSAVLDVMGKAKYGYVMKDKKKWIVAQRQARGSGSPWLVVKK